MRKSYDKIIHPCGYDGIGRHARFRFSCSNALGFEPPCPHHVGASYISLAPTYFISQSALIPPLLLSKSNPLRWASIWFCVRIGTDIYKEFTPINEDTVKKI